MALVLQQIRRCDGQCCKESPRFPNPAGTDCIHHLNPKGKESSGCALMVDSSQVPVEGFKSRLIRWEDRDARDVFQETCINWPQNIPLRVQRLTKTGGCCWQFVDDGF